MSAFNEKQAEELIARGVERAFVQMGIDTANPREMQQDMAFLRKYRHRADSIGNRLFMWLFIVMVTGGSLASWKDAIADVFRGQ